MNRSIYDDLEDQRNETDRLARIFVWVLAATIVAFYIWVFAVIWEVGADWADQIKEWTS